MTDMLCNDDYRSNSSKLKSDCFTGVESSHNGHCYLNAKWFYVTPFEKFWMARLTPSPLH